MSDEDTGDRDGEQTGQHLHEEFEKTRIAAEHGSRYEKFHLACLYKDGEGVPRDLDQATRWYRLCLEDETRGSFDLAESMLADLYRKRIEAGEPLLDEALPWLKRSALNGDGRTAYFLAERYRQGDGLPEDLTESVIWYRTAAGHGNIDAMIQLGYLHREGFGVPESTEASLSWFRMAAEMNSQAAQALVVHTLLDNRPTAAMRRESRFWLCRAATSNDQSAIDLLERLDPRWRTRNNRPVANGSACDRMFVSLSDEDIQTLLRHSYGSTLSPFMLAAPPATRLAVFSNLSSAATELLRSEMTRLGNPTPDAVAQARQTLIATARQVLGAEVVGTAIRWRLLSWLPQTFNAIGVK